MLTFSAGQTVVLPKSVTPSRIVENLNGKYPSHLVQAETDWSTVVKLPEDLFNKLEAAAAAHPPKRVVNPSKGWGLSFDIFDDDGVVVPKA